MPTSPAATDLPRSQEQIATRHEQRLRDPSELEVRQIVLAHVSDRAHVEAFLPVDDPAQYEELAAGYPETAPTREQVLSGLKTGSQVNDTDGNPRFIPPVHLPGMLNLIRKVRDQADMLAEFAWVLGRDDISEAITAPGEHHPAGLSLLTSLVRFCRAHGINLPKEGPDGELAADLAEAVAAVEAETNTEEQR